jgi:non-canonical purine NTP pyrophosphatase (RdgB/HAM1 family)
MKKVILYATTNTYKLLAANTALKAFDVTLENLPDNFPDVPEIQADTQEEIAFDKAKKYFDLIKRPLIAMDFGFFIVGLNGFPGVYTKHTIKTIGVDGLITLAGQLKDRTAYTQRTIVYIDGTTEKAFSSRCPGTIVLDKKGTNGRDYDLVFRVDANSKTLAEMDEVEKAAVSGEAWRNFGTWFRLQNP